MREFLLACGAGWASLLIIGLVRYGWRSLWQSLVGAVRYVHVALATRGQVTETPEEEDAPDLTVDDISAIIQAASEDEDRIHLDMWERELASDPGVQKYMRRMERWSK